MDNTTARLDRLEALLNRVLPHVLSQVAQTGPTIDSRSSGAQVTVIPDLYQRDKTAASQTPDPSQVESAADPWEDDIDEDEDFIEPPPIRPLQPSRKTAAVPSPSPGLPTSTARCAQALLQSAKSTPFTRETGVTSAGVGSFKRRNGGGGYTFGGHALQQTSRPPKQPMKDVRVCKTGMVRNLDWAAL